MGKLKIYVLAALTFSCFSNVWAQVKDEISLNNYFAIPENVVNGDEVGDMKTWYVRSTSGSVEFSIEQNVNGIYTINSTSGKITIADASHLSVTKQDVIHYLIIRSQDGEFYDIDTAFIRVKDKSYCKFVDGSATSNGDGTRDNPYNSWKKVNIQSGYGYFQKRGTTTYSKTIYVHADGTPDNPIVIAAYGSGSKPVFDGTEPRYNYVKGISVGDLETYFSDYVQIYDLDFYNWAGNGIYVYNFCTHIEVNNCIFRENGKYNNPDSKGPGLYFYGDKENHTPQYNITRNCESYNNTEHGFKYEGTNYCFIYNCYAHDNGNQSGHGFQLAGGTHNEYYGLLAIDNRNAGISSRGINDKFDNVVCKENINGIQIWHAHNPAHGKNNSYKNVQVFNNSDAGLLLMENVIGMNIEDFKSYNNKWGVRIRGQVENSALNRGYIHDNSSYGVFLDSRYDFPGNKNLKFYYLLIYNNGGYGFFGDFNTENVEIFNTTFYNNEGEDIKISSNITGCNIINSIYGSASGQFASTTNLNYNNVSGIFKSAQTFDLIPDEEGPAVDNGTSLNLTCDIEGKCIVNQPEIGAYELVTESGDSDGDTSVADNDTTGYQDDETSDIPDNDTTQDDQQNTDNPDSIEEFNAPIINDQNFVFYYSGNSDNTIGQVNAYDPEGDPLEFHIVSGNENNLFDFDQINGTLSFKSLDYLNIEDIEKFELKIVCEENSTAELQSFAIITVTVIPEYNIVYIDPENNKDAFQNGTKDHPYASWKNVQWEEETFYLQKTNTVAYEGKILVTAGNITIGSYGTGNNPKIQSLSTDYAIKLINKSNVVIKNLEIEAEEAIANIYFLGGESENNTIENCRLYGAQYGLRLIEGSNYIVKYNTITSKLDAVYTMASNTEYYYNIFKNNNTAINIASLTSDAVIYNNVFYNNNYGISSNYASITLYNNIFYMLDIDDCAINHDLDKIISDNNLFYPESDGFIQINNKHFSTLQAVQSEYNIELNSLTEDPRFIDVYDGNFDLDDLSPAIDAGRFIGIFEDIYGYKVPMGKAPDIGVIEKTADNKITGTGNYSSENNPYKVYPNPSNGVINVMFDEMEPNDGILEIRDISGKKVYNCNLNNIDFYQGKQIDLTDVKKGMYFINLKNNDHRYSEKIIIY